MATETTPLPQTLSKFEYEKLIEDEEINVQLLPTAVKQKINAISMQKAKYVKNPTHGKLEGIKKDDAYIADLIQDWLEKDLADPVDETPPASEGTPADALPVKTEAELAKEKADAEAAEKAEAELKAKQAVEEKFKAVIAKDGRIHESELKRLLSKTRLDDKEEFAGVKLKRGMSFLSSVHYYTDK